MLLSRPILSACLLIAFFLAGRSSFGASTERWSVQLLGGSAAASPENAEVGRGEESPVGRSPGLVLRTYQFRNLSLSDDGRSRNILALIGKLLPPGSEIKSDSAANSLHVLTTVAAHAAVWDFVSTIDVKPLPDAPAPGLSTELRDELRKIEAAKPQTEKLQQSVESLRSELNGFASDSARTRASVLTGAKFALGLLFAGVLAYLVRKRRLSRKRLETEAASKPVPSVAELLVPQQITSALEPMQRQMQQEMLGALNAAAARMDAWYKDQKSQRDQLVQLASDQESRLAEVRSQLLRENRELFLQTNARFEESASRIEQGVQSLAVQNDRVGALAGELSVTVRELDTTKDQLLNLRQELELKSSQLDRTRETLSTREGELAKQQAKLAALTLILEEGSGRAELRLSSEAPVSGSADRGLTTLQGESANPIRAKMRFRFLPPETKFV